MKAKVKIEKEVELKTLHVHAGVRYWEDATINGQPDDEDGSHIPCKSGGAWCPVIDIDTGQILNWEAGKAASIHYKVCDNGSYYIRDEAGNTVLSIEEDYVPAIMNPKEDGYGDYIIMDIDENGFIKKWTVELEEFTEHTP